MRQFYPVGERLFVDYAGMTMPVNDPAGGESFAAQIFVAALGASHYLYAEATRTEQIPDWIDSHVRTFEHLGGVTEILSPDNLKSGVTRACRYEPDANPTYLDMARFYGVAVIPRRPGKPRDGAKVESGVQIVEREVLARLRDQTLFSLGELNRAMWALLEKVNRRPFQKLDYSRLDLFNELDKSALRSLPAARYELADFLQPTVNIDYHIEVVGHYYSVPFELKGQKLDVRLTARTVEALHRGKRVASHPRDDRKGRYTTDPAHMPKAHRACLGIIRLSRSYETQRVEAACRRALALDVCSYRSIQSILKTGKDREPLPGEQATVPVCNRYHDNVRGAAYYAQPSPAEPCLVTEEGGAMN